MTQEGALLLTLAFEAAPVAVYLAFRRGGPPSESRLLLTAACASLLTHPLAWAANVALASALAAWPRLVLIEAVVTLAEAAVYRHLADLRWPVALALSLAANATSTLLGLVVLLG